MYYFLPTTSPDGPQGPFALVSEGSLLFPLNRFAPWLDFSALLAAPPDGGLRGDVLVSLPSSLQAVLFPPSQRADDCLSTDDQHFYIYNLFSSSLWSDLSGPTPVAMYGCGANKVGDLLGVSWPGDVAAVLPAS